MITLVVSTGVVLGVRAFLLKDYVTVLKYDEAAARMFITEDSITIDPFFYVENSSTLGAVVDFQSLPDSLQLENLSVTVSSPDNDHQTIQLKKVSTVVHPVTGDGISDGTLKNLDVSNFEALPVFYKTIRPSGLPYNKIGFHFSTKQVKKTRFYHFRIRGRFIFRGRHFNFDKKVETERKLEYQPYRMMT